MAGGSVTGILIGAGLTIISTVIVRLWQYERERWTGRVDWFCESVDEAANLGVEYWIEAGQSDADATDRKREVQLVGFQIKLDGILETFIEKMRKDDVGRIRELLQQFRDALTGGDFQSKSVKSDLERARNVQFAASELFVCIRQSLDNTLMILPKRFRDLGDR